MLETSARMFAVLLQEIDRCSSPFPIGVLRCESPGEGGISNFTHLLIVLKSAR